MNESIQEIQDETHLYDNIWERVFVCILLQTDMRNEDVRALKWICADWGRTTTLQIDEYPLTDNGERLRPAP